MTRVQAVRPAERAAQRLAGDLAGAVQVDGQQGLRLVDGQVDRFAVHLARGGEDDAADAGPAGGAQDVEGAHDVGGEGVVGVLDAAHDRRLCGEVVDDVRVAERRATVSRIANVALTNAKRGSSACCSR